MAVLEPVYAYVHAVCASRGTNRKGATLVATHVKRVAKAIASVACPQTYILRRLSLEVRIGTIPMTRFYDISMGFHTHDGLAHVASGYNLPGFLRSLDIALVKPFDRHGVEHGSHFLD